MAKISTQNGAGPTPVPSMAEILANLGEFLAVQASHGVSARIAYGNLLEELLVRFELMANGAQLMEIFQAFNRSRDAGHATLPLGTAGTAAESAANFRNKVAKGYRSRLPLDSVSLDMGERVASMFDAIVQELRASIEISTRSQIDSLNQAHVAALAASVAECDLVAQGLRAQRESLSLQLEEADSLLKASEAARETAAKRSNDLLASLDALQTRFQAVSSREAVARANIEVLEKRLATIDDELAKVKLSEADERRVRLLGLDRNRQLELQLQKLQLGQESSASRVGELESQLKKEESRNEGLAAQLAAAQLRCDTAQRSLSEATAAFGGSPGKRLVKFSRKPVKAKGG